MARVCAAVCSKKLTQRMAQDPGEARRDPSLLLGLHRFRDQGYHQLYNLLSDI